MKKITSGIYKINNIINSKCYIGSAISFTSRWAKHKRDLEQDKHHSKHLQRAWNLYGSDNFNFEILEYVETLEDKNEFKKYMLQREQYYIDLFDSYNNGYNECPIAGSRLGSKATEETKLKQHNSLKGRMFSEDHRKKLSESAKLKEFTKETIEKFRNRMSGIKLSEQTKQKMSLSRKGQKRNNIVKKNISNALKGKTFTEIHKQNLSKSAQNRYIDKNNHPWNGKQHSQQSKEKMSITKNGKKASDETKQKMSQQRKGENHPRTKLNDINVIHIKNLIKTGEKINTICKMYSVNRSVISNIKNNRSWTHIVV